MCDQAGGVGQTAPIDLPPSRQEWGAYEVVDKDSGQGVDGHECEDGNTDCDGLDPDVLVQSGGEVEPDQTEREGDKSEPKSSKLINSGRSRYSPHLFSPVIFTPLH